MGGAPRLGFLAAHPYLATIALAVGASLFTIAVAALADLPIRDPDGVAGTPLVRLSLIMLALFALDIAPRAALRTRRGQGRLRDELCSVLQKRWSWKRALIVVAGLLSFYVTYVSYRNLKSFLPFIRDELFDGALLQLERDMLLGVDPANLLHDLLGTGVAAHALSVVYLFFLLFVPLSLAAALVWTSDLPRGFWYVTALGVNWLLGTASYYVLPSMGPVFVAPGLFADLPATGVSELQEALLAHRVEVLSGPHATGEIQSIAGFASLHVSIAFTAAAIAQLVGLRRLVRGALWAFLGLTVVSTIYFGWHYIVDDLAGIAIGAAAVWIGAVVTGHDVRALLGRALAPAQSSTRLT